MNTKQVCQLEFLGFVDFGYLHETLWRLHQPFANYVEGSLLVGTSLLDLHVLLPEPQNVAYHCDYSRQTFKELWGGQKFDFYVKSSQGAAETDTP